MSNYRKRAVVEVSLGLLGEVLHLPPGTRVVDLRCPRAENGSFEILVEHESLPAVDFGERSPRAQCVVSIAETNKMVPERVFASEFVVEQPKEQAAANSEENAA